MLGSLSKSKPAWSSSFAARQRRFCFWCESRLPAQVLQLRRAAGQPTVLAARLVPPFREHPWPAYSFNVDVTPDWLVTDRKRSIITQRHRSAEPRLRNESKRRGSLLRPRLSIRRWAARKIRGSSCSAMAEDKAPD